MKTVGSRDKWDWYKIAVLTDFGICKLLMEGCIIIS
jgi:hypothetical protein